MHTKVILGILKFKIKDDDDDGDNNNNKRLEFNIAANEKFKIANILLMDNRRAKCRKTWASGIVYLCGSIRTDEIKVILESLGALVSQWPVTRNTRLYSKTA